MSNSAHLNRDRPQDGGRRVEISERFKINVLESYVIRRVFFEFC